jgi:dienelactone hydrolase
VTPLPARRRSSACGAHDQVIPPERAERAAETLDDAGAEVRFERYGVGHGTTPEESPTSSSGSKCVLTARPPPPMRNAFD